MPASPIACQLYTLREFTKTPADIAKTLKRVKQIGYDAVQASALGPIEPAELAKILKGEGLACCATHVSKERMRDETQKVIDDHKLWGCKYTAVGGFHPKDAKTADWVNFANEYNQIAKKFEGTGISIGYHNHSHELSRYDGKTAMQILLDHLSPSVWWEIDTYWITHGGGDPRAWIKKVAGRIPCVHLKDMGVRPDRTQYMAEIGEGNLDFPGILQTCRDAGVEWYIVEQDNTNGRDPFESIAVSLANLKTLGLN